MTPETVGKLEHAFALGCTDLEACFYADIHKDTLYNYQLKYPEFVDRKEALKLNPVLKARTNVMASIEGGDVDNSKWLLESRKKDEFSTRTENEITMKDSEILERIKSAT